MRATGVVALAVLFAAAPASAQVFRSGVDMVSLGVTVADKAGGLVTGLTPEDFAIFEDGVRQDVRLFVDGQTAEGDRPPLHIGLLFDTSGSMVDDLAMARTAAIRFCNVLSRAEDITLVDFDTEVRVARFGQNDFPRFVERLRNRKPEGWTALYDALGVYLDGTSFQSGEKVVVVYSDGGDTRSVMNFGDVITGLKAADVTVYVVGFLQNQSSRGRVAQRLRLTQLAEATGGMAFFPASQQEIDKAYAQVLEEVNSRYTLGYVSTNQREDGGWRKVEIRLVRPDLKTAKIRARKGYYSVLRQAALP
jgi:Ca-activated chloride channel family protein